MTGRYDDKFDEIVKYLEMSISDDGKKVKMNDKEDLRAYLENLNKKEEEKGSAPRLTAEFIEGILGTKRAKNFFPKTFGRFGKEQRFDQVGLSIKSKKPILTSEQRTVAKKHYEQGKQSYVTDKETLAYATSIRRGGRYIHLLREEKTGRFVKKTTSRRIERKDI